MSSTGHGGVTVITGANHAELTPVSIPAFSQIVFTHNTNRFAFSVIVTGGEPSIYGRVLTSNENVFVTQPDANAIIVGNNNAQPLVVFVSCRWEEPTPELDLVPSLSDPRIVIEQIPG